MQKAQIAVIGGSGLYNLDGAEVVEELQVETPFGEHSGPIYHVNVKGTHALFLPRHGKGHRYLPSEVNYRANIFALKSLGVRYITSVSAVGSLREDLPPKTFFLPDQFIDWTKGKRERTFFGEGVVGHTSAAYPVENVLREMMAERLTSLGIDFKTTGSYICIEGPQFSSRAESEFYRSMGCSVIGMTNVPEAYLAKEAGIAYATVAMVTDFDCWKEEHCQVDEIMRVMNHNQQTAAKFLLDYIPHLGTNLPEFTRENEFAVLTPKENIPSDKAEMLEVLLAR